MSTKLTAVRLDTTLLERIEAFRQEMEQAMPGPTFSQSDAIRYLLTRALDDLDKRHSR